MGMSVPPVNSKSSRKHFGIPYKFVNPELRTNHNARLDKGNNISKIVGLIFNTAVVEK